MVNKVVTYLIKPYPYTISLASEIKAQLIIASFVVSTLFIVSPLLYDFLTTQQLTGFIVIAILMMVFNIVCTLFVFRKFIREEKWVVWKEIIKAMVYIYILTISLLYYVSLVSIHIEFTTLIQYISYAFLFAIIPISIRINAISFSILKTELSELKQLNKTIGGNLTKLSKKKITIKSHLVNDALTTSENELLYIKSEQNYIQVTLIEGEKTAKKLIRLSLVKAMEQINSERIVRCHRSYIINLNYIQEVKKNAQGLKLVFIKGAGEIPVSKQYKKMIIDKVKKYSKTD